MRSRTVVVGLAWLAAIIAAAALLVVGQTGSSDLFSARWSVIFVALALDVAAYASVGAVLAIRRAENIVGGLLLGAGLMIALTFLGFIGGAILQAQSPEDPLAALAALFGGLTIGATLIIAGAAPALVFPDGHLPGRRWRWPVGALVVAVTLSAFANVLRPGPLGSEMAQNPFGVSGIASVDALLSVADVLAAVTIPVAMVMAVVAVIVRYRRSRSAEREQLKWFVAADFLVAVLLMLSLADGAGEPTPFDILAVASLSLPPIAIGIAVLRYRLYEIDRIISRTIGYALVTGVLVAVFTGAVLGLQTILEPLTAGSTVAVAVSTLAVAALFQPLRQRVQRGVDQRFDRGRYDGQKVIDALSRHLRDEVDLDRLRTALVATADEIVRPVDMSIWLRSREPGR